MYIYIELSLKALSALQASTGLTVEGLRKFATTTHICETKKCPLRNRQTTTPGSLPCSFENLGTLWLEGKDCTRDMDK